MSRYLISFALDVWDDEGRDPRYWDWVDMLNAACGEEPDSLDEYSIIVEKAGQ